MYGLKLQLGLILQTLMAQFETQFCWTREKFWEIIQPYLTKKKKTKFLYFALTILMSRVKVCQTQGITLMLGIKRYKKGLIGKHQNQSSVVEGGRCEAVS